MRTRALLVVVIILGAIFSLLLPILPSTETVQVPYTVEKPQVDYTLSSRTEVVLLGTTLQTVVPSKIEFKHQYNATARYDTDSKRVMSVSVHGRIRNLSQDTTARNVEVKFVLSMTMIYMESTGTEKFSYVVGTLKPNEEKAYTATVTPRSTWYYPMIYIDASDIVYVPEPRSRTITTMTHVVVTILTSELLPITVTRTETGLRPESRTGYLSLIGFLGLEGVETPVLILVVVGLAVLALFLLVKGKKASTRPATAGPTAAEKTPARKFCINCATSLPADAQTCERCGSMQS